MNRDFELVDARGHLVFALDGDRVLVDTGAPQSVGRDQRWEFLGRSVTLAPSYMGVTPDQLAKEVGSPLDILMGVDLISRFAVTIDLRARRIGFDSTVGAPDSGGGADPPEGEAAASGRPIVLPVTDFMGVPIIQAGLGGEAVPAFFDTGAQLSYGDERDLSRYPRLGEVEDFYPGLGRFRTPVYQAPLKLGGREFSIRFGVLPPVLRMTLMMADARAIVGAELFRHVRARLVLGRKRIELLPFAV